MSGLKDREAARVWDRAYKARNPDKVKAQHDRGYVVAKRKYKTSAKYRAYRRAITAAWEKRNPAKVTALRQNRRRAQRAWLDEQKATKSCARCGEADVRCLDFHHIDPKEKRFALAQVGTTGWSVASMKAELLKCEVLCANCHRKEHHKEMRAARPGHVYG